MKENDLINVGEELNLRMGRVRGEVTYLDSEGEEITNAKEYFENIKKNLIVSKKLNVGDVIKTKYIEGKCLIEEVDCLLNQSIQSDYLVRTETGEKFFIGQEDILEVCNKSR